MFILKGKKQLASRHIYSALLRLKLEQDLNPVLYLLEILDQSKPLFKLDH